MDNSEKDRMLVQIHANVERIMTLVEKHERELYGNHQPGLVKDFVELKTQFNNQAEYLDDLEKALNQCISQISKLEKDNAIVSSKLDTGKAVVAWLINLLLTIFSIVLGVTR
ncbi:MAG: hypothetical protein J6Y62_07130 [Clostridia bacterium]|nr:hypothetical protein [Clostridia bacterium]